MQKRINSYTFNPSARTVTLTELATIDHDAVISIVNTRNGVYLYKAESAVPKIEIAGNIITCFIDLSDHNATDPLLIYYDDATYPATSEEIVADPSGVSSESEAQALRFLLMRLLGALADPVWLDKTRNGLNSVLLSGSTTAVTGTITVSSVTNIPTIGLNPADPFIPATMANQWGNTIRAFLT